MILHGDCIERLKEFPDNYFDAVVTDPPYGWRFMGKSWDDADILLKSRQAKRPGESYVGTDGITRQTRSDASMAAGKYDQSLAGNLAFMEWSKDWAIEVLRILKPGGHALIFCGPRTYHAMAMGVEMAGFEIRDQLQWLFGSGFPKSLNLKDKHKGWGTALKPANEPICLARKPLEKGLTVAENVLKWGTGAINVDGSRIGTEARTYSINGAVKGGNFGNSANQPAKERDEVSVQGRWPANVLFDEAAAEMLGEPSRFFYVAKTSKRERNAGLEGMPTKAGEPNQELGANASHRQANAQERAKGITHVERIHNQNNHPTVKPIKLMEYLCRLITPPSGLILDPFMGSGSTGIAAKNLGFGFVGCEMNKEYCEIAEKRMA